MVSYSSITSGLCSSLNVSDQVSHPYKPTGKILLLYTLTFIFLDTKLEVAACAPTDSEHCLAAVFSSLRLGNFDRLAENSDIIRQVLSGRTVLTADDTGLSKTSKCHECLFGGMDTCQRLGTGTPLTGLGLAFCALTITSQLNTYRTFRQPDIRGPLPHPPNKYAS